MRPEGWGRHAALQLACALVLASGAASDPTAEITVGVSWSNFQEERWKTDEAAMKAAIEANGDTYICLLYTSPSPRDS